MQMMQKLRVDEPTLPAHCQRLLMFRELCLHPRIDSGVFSRVARRYGVLTLRIGPTPGGAGRIDPDSGTSMDALAPLYAAALRSIAGRLPELDQRGIGRGIERKWDICGVRLASTRIALARFLSAAALSMRARGT